MHRFVPVLLILALALGACGHKKAPAPSASSSSVTADTLIYNSAHSDIAMDKWLACARFVQGTEMSGGSRPRIRSAGPSEMRTSC